MTWLSLDISLQAKETTTSLILTKLNRPRFLVDLVPWPHLTAWLEQRRSRPLTLVSAPVGDGKSTLISCWLESVDCPIAWLRLDEHDNDLGHFLGYFIAAIQTIFPGTVPETQALLNVTLLPPIATTAHSRGTRPKNARFVHSP